MSIDRLRSRMAVSFVAAVVCVLVGQAQAAGVDFVGAVEATHPLAYYRLDAPTGKSVVGPTTYKSFGGVTGAGPGAPIGAANNHSVQLNGHDGYIVSTQAGGVGETASMMAWVNLVELPSKAGHFFYVAGESQNGNDLDVQIETDNVLKFYTASGGNLAYTPPVATLVGQWHWIVATLDTATHSRVIYWDGKQVAADKGGGRAGKTGLFSIGASTVFSGRFFHGGIEEAALWNRALTAAEVAGIYATAKPVPGATSNGPGSLGGTAATGGPTTNAKVELVDATGPLTLKDPEKIAFMFVSAMEQIEQECFRAGNHVCTINEMVAGPVVKGQHIAGLKFDPKTDPNYTYTLNDPQNGEWAINADPKKPGLIDFCLSAHNYFVTTVTYSRKGKATPTDTGFTSTGITGDSFRTQ
jgi:hypothetical protein